MNKILSNIKYKMTYQSGWAAWYLVSYLITMLLVYIVLLRVSIISGDEGSFIYRIWGSIVFQFAVTMRFKEDFNFFLTLSNTRTQIFKSLLGAAIGFSAFFSILITLERYIVDKINIAQGFYNINDPIHLLAPYATEFYSLTFLFFFICCVLLSNVSILLGSLFTVSEKNSH